MPHQDEAALLPDATWLRRFRKQIIGWFAQHARELPWRQSRDPYAIWVSEVMLQQTQVATVVPYFQRFMARFPDVETLADAEEEEVLRHWEGLGYYRRGRQLHRAARVIRDEHGGVFPTDFADVLRLPGIGRYTAGAILSIALDQRWPILEANTVRLYARLLAYPHDLTLTSSQQLLWEFAARILPIRQVGHFNQGLMELGSTICTPKQPKCLLCPVAELCPTRREDLQTSIPKPKRKVQITEQHEVAVVVYQNEHVLLRRCRDGERWAGLWDFPRFVQDSPGESFTAPLQQLTGLAVVPRATLTTIRHGVTRFRITLRCELADFQAGTLLESQENGRDSWAWTLPHELSRFPLSVTGRKIARLIQAGPKRDVVD